MSGNEQWGTAQRVGSAHSARLSRLYFRRKVVGVAEDPAYPGKAQDRLECGHLFWPDTEGVTGQKAAGEAAWRLCRECPRPCANCPHPAAVTKRHPISGRRVCAKWPLCSCLSHAAASPKKATAEALVDKVLADTSTAEEILRKFNLWADLQAGVTA